MFRGEISLSQLHAFTLVAEELHFGRAAARLGIAQPPLSQQIQRLEAFIGHRLFERDTRKVQLTDAGRAMQAFANRLLLDMAEGIDRVQRVGRGEAGVLTVGFTSTTALHVLPAIVQANRQHYPDVDLRLVEILPEPLWDSLRSGRIDFALSRDMLPEPGVDVIDLLHETYIVVLPAGHALAAGHGPVPLAALAGERFILFPRNRVSRYHDRLRELCLQAGFAPRSVQEAPGWQTAISLVGAGVGITILPACTASLTLPGVVFRPVDSPARSSITLSRRAGDDRALVGNFLSVARTAMACE
ncbi:LysR substrate-binding domain-containing protein [Niveispirillum fermenti]|uniref:LysR substrate-binding domain-containing protein n=1 Tax=Niveispirillum fermenti TaxID=1233113 RepID=UPI003A86BCD5